MQDDAPPGSVPCQQCGKPLLADAQFCSKCGTSVAQQALDASVPSRLQAALGPDYQVMGELGNGGFAVVYLVRDSRLNRSLAVKVMQPYLLASRRAVERFQREARFAAQLNHPNILAVSFAGSAAGLVYYAMPPVKGRTLREHIARNKPMPVAEALRIFTEVAQGLEHAHTRGIVHRDIKPGNIMLDPDGRALILDFGIAKGLSAGDTSLTGSGEIIGSPEYLSPEQASGEGEVDARSDIYSLGVVGFEMLAGVPPFRGRSSGEVIRHHIDTPAPDVREHRPEVPEAFAAAIHRCMEKERGRRWVSAVEAARFAGADVSPWTSDETVGEMRPTVAAVTAPRGQAEAVAAGAEQRFRDALAPLYRIERQVGRGAMATVYLAHDVKHDREVALKLLTPEMGLGVRVERFAREIGIAAKLHHPHILPVYDSGRAEGFFYYVMPYVDGVSLRERLHRDGRLPVEEAAQIARDVADALEYAHTRGVIHRDIKPENIMLSGSHAMVTDFGIARALEAADSGKLTATGFTVGTPWYMSPEQGAAEESIDGRADVYSLACVLFEMVSGRLPYRGVTPQEVATQHSRDPVPSIRDVHRGLPEALDLLIQRNMAKEPKNRVRSAGEFGQALASAVVSAAARPSKRRWFW